MIKKKFWKNKKVLITGHTGFKGRWLTILLKNLGANVNGISFKEKKNFRQLEYINFLEKKNSFNIDIRKKNDVNKVIKKINPEIIIHMAAQSKVLDGYNFPIKTFETNFMGTVNILETSVKLKKVKTILVVTTDKVYENINKIKKFSENDKLGGDDPYSASKASTEIILNYYRKFFPEKKIISVRAGNIIGGGDFGSNRIIPDFMKAWKSKKKLIIRNPKSTRPWQYVLDVLLYYTKIIEKTYKSQKFSPSYNIGPFNSGLNVYKLVLKLKYHFKDLKISIKQKNTFKEKKHLNLDTKKIVNFLKLKNIIKIDERIQRTAKIYKQILNKKINSNIDSIYKEETLKFIKENNG